MATKKEAQAVEPEKATTEVAKKEQTMSERFTAMVTKEFSSGVGKLEITDAQRSLIQGYYINVDRALATAEDERQRKNANNKDHKYDNTLPVTWANVNLPDLALDLVHYAKIGLDMSLDNMLFPIPYKNNKTGKYDITLMEGYNGKRYIGEKYALDKPIRVTIEVVYSTDKFKPIKKDATHNEGYEFEITNPFDRGEIIGGFAYLAFKDSAKNTLIMMSRADIEKRKPRYASANFWGGTQKTWENGKQVEVENEGWYPEMVRKTLIREAYSAKYLPRDPKKVDDAYRAAKAREAEYAKIEADAEIAEQGNKIYVDPSAVQEVEETELEVMDTPTGEQVIYPEQVSLQDVTPSDGVDF